MATQEEADQQERERRADQLWTISRTAINDLWSHNHRPEGIPLLQARCTIAGIFRMLAVAKLHDTSRALRLRLITSFPIDLTPGERISLAAYIDRLTPTGEKIIMSTPASSRQDWVMFSRLVEKSSNGAPAEWTEFTRSNPLEVWEYYAKMARELPAFKAVYY